MHEVYEPVVAIEVVAKLVDRFPEISMLMIGPDKGDGSLERVRSAIDSFGLGKQDPDPGRCSQDGRACLARSG